MTTIREGHLVFEFPSDWKATKYDDWAFYRRQFQGFCAASRAVDIAAIDPSGCLWLIEVKDYRLVARSREKGELEVEVASKMRDTVVGLVAAGIHASDPGETEFAHQGVRCVKVRIVLHLEQPQQHSKLFPRAYDPAKVEQKLKQLLKPLDPHPQVHDRDNLRGATWTVK